MISEPEGAPQARTSCILVVEDEVLIRAFIADILRDEGFTVVEAINADEAWQFLEAGGHVDLVFSDIDMPGSMDGLVLGERIKERHPHVPLILTSGGPNAAGAFTLGQFLPKPFQVGQALSMISSLLDSAKE